MVIYNNRLFWDHHLVSELKDHNCMIYGSVNSKIIAHDDREGIREKTLAYALSKIKQMTLP